ncbi:TorF family putative porin [Pseudorhodoferax sp.]|uniref:TorF family putative porin n=1 Tax=Pseudorhodoferax sp. TaxID=1993553 RepID=UPI002DD6565A|nr:TorF family putative porin [Pseudorhodoferax sp.]
MKKHLVALAAFTTLSLPALAEVSANLALTSNYKFRGQDQTSNKPAFSGGFDYEAGGFYIGNWNSSIGFTDAGIEMDLYGGYKVDLGGVELDVGALLYYYPQKEKDANLNTTEIYFGASFGVFSAKYSHAVSSKWFGVEDGRGTGYLDLSVSVPLSDTISLDAHYGLSRFSSGAKSAGLVNYGDYKIGASFDLGNGFSASAAYVGANKKNVYGDINKGRVIFTISKAL